MATPNEDNFGRGDASEGMWLLFAILLTIVVATKEKGIYLVKSIINTDITLTQYWVGAGVLLVVIGVLAKLFQDSYRESQQEAREAGLEEAIFTQARQGKVNPPYFLYLRPFIPRGKFLYQDEEELESIKNISSFAALPLEDIEVILGKAVQPNRFHALGHKGEAIGAARIEVEDHQWKEKLKILVKHAEGILLIPAITEGSLWEMAYLLDRPKLLKKTIFLMPPEYPTFSRLLTKEPSLVKEEWGLLHESATAEGIDFPAYDEKGLLFKFSPSGSLLQKAVPNWNHPSELGEAVRKLLASA